MSEPHPMKGEIILAWWASESRWTRAKWTGRRWMRFNELFGGYDPVDAPEKWKHFEDT